MIARVHSFVLQGIDAVPCEIEADIAPIGMPKTTIVGLPDAAVKEAAERVRTAMLNSGFVWPQHRVTINLAPADLRKEGPVFDLPVAIAMLLADGTIAPAVEPKPDGGPQRPEVGRILRTVAPSCAGAVRDGAEAAQRTGEAIVREGPTDSSEDEAVPTFADGAARPWQRAGASARGGPCGEAGRALASPGVALEADSRTAPCVRPDGKANATSDATPNGASGATLHPASHVTARTSATPRPDPDAWLLAGELALDGRLRPIRGVISLALLAQAHKRRGVIVPADNASEAAVVDGIEVRSARHLAEVVAFFQGLAPLVSHPTLDVDSLIAATTTEIDFADVRGQEAAKRAMTIAGGGGHNILLIGPAGTGKTMMARALPGILPTLSRDEALEVTRIYSSIGALPRGAPVLAQRPVRTPHHTASTPAVVGGGTIPRPGEVSLAHRGILFLDELPEFSRLVLESLREPLEDGHVTIARAHGSIRFPARVMLVAAMNPTQQGNGRVADVAGDPRERYLSRLSGPLVDRIDLHVEVPAVPFRQLAGDRRGTDSATMRARVLAARGVQRARQGPRTNSELGGRLLDRHAPLCDEGRRLLGRGDDRLGTQPRGPTTRSAASPGRSPTSMGSRRSGPSTSPRPSSTASWTEDDDGR
ncbi:MAG: YifB family Mg chelatase-like AAA ATPase [Phycisphaerales bacterium]